MAKPICADYLVDIERYTMKDSAEAIRCPTLLTAAENDPWLRALRRCSTP
jgi:hypothetical protein